MEFIRPEIREATARWRETLIGVALALFGTYWTVTQQGILAVLGTIFVMLGVVLAFAGIQRARFRRGTDGPGVVQVTERMVTYFGPLDGGSVSIDALVEVELDPTSKPVCWVLTQPGTPPLNIPVTAQNADILFDVFASLDGIRTENMLNILSRHPSQRVVIWNSPPRRLH